MQVEYRKEQTDTYLWVLPEGDRRDGFEEQMLLWNQGEGRLEFSKKQKDGEEFFCYRITGKKALSSIYSAIHIGERQIKELLQQIFRIVEAGKEYLLSEEDFVLTPNYVFAILPRMEVELCYVPGYRKPLKEQLESLLEYLLNRVDYEDKEAVELLYDCYMYCMQEKGGPEEIKKRLERPETEKRADSVSLPDTLSKTESQDADRKTEEKSSSYFSWLMDFFSSKRKRESILLGEEKEEYSPSTGKSRPEIKEEKTVLLAVVTQTREFCLVNKETGESIEIKKFPYYIGSASEYADYLLEKTGVSRIHCCINKKGENYVLSDLNSTNGTYLDGKEVLPGKEVNLSYNSTICIAKEEFSVDFPCH